MINEKARKGKDAIEKLCAAKELVNEAYKGLVDSGLNARAAKTICRCYTGKLFGVEDERVDDKEDTKC